MDVINAQDEVLISLQSAENSGGGAMKSDPVLSSH